jgi:molybdopterin synthase catalytic subunit
MLDGERVRLYCRLLPANTPTSAARLAQTLGSPETGAIVTFEGAVRETEEARRLSGIGYEYHPVMASQELARLCEQALQKFEIQQIACEHRTGFVPVQEISIAIAIAAAHREAAFRACEYVLDLLKKTVPIWKSPVYKDL